jgi:menaquinone-dependent protoporphyrinogen oxidase
MHAHPEDDTTPEGGREREERPAAVTTAAPARILIAYATKHGSTAELAEWIADEIRGSGADADVVPVTAAPSPAPYDAVVIGGPMIMGWHKDAGRFLKRRAGELSGKPTALFITAASLTETGEEQIDGIPVTRDPWLVKEPRDPTKLGRKERYAVPRHYLEDALEAAPGLRPVAAAFFGGSLDLTKMNLFEKLFVMLAIRATPGDARNEKAVRAWAREITPLLLR